MYLDKQTRIQAYIHRYIPLLHALKYRSGTLLGCLPSPLIFRGFVNIKLAPAGITQLEIVNFNVDILFSLCVGALSYVGTTVIGLSIQSCVINITLTKTIYFGFEFCYNIIIYLVYNSVKSIISWLYLHF